MITTPIQIKLKLFNILEWDIFKNIIYQVFSIKMIYMLKFVVIQIINNLSIVYKVDCKKKGAINNGFLDSRIWKTIVNKKLKRHLVREKECKVVIKCLRNWCGNNSRTCIFESKK